MKPNVYAYLYLLTIPERSNRVKIRPFEPGDATRYMVAWQLMPVNYLPGYQKPVFFAFGVGDHPMQAYAFESEAGAGYGYFVSKLYEGRDENPVTKVTAYRVFCEIAGQKALYEPDKYPEMEVGWRDWHAGWQEQLR